MAQTYTRQSSIADGDTITAALFNNEYNQLLNAFSYSSSSASSTGHRHDGTAGQGGNVHTIGDLDFLNKIVVDSTNNRWGVFVEVSSAAVEQIRIQDGAIVPVTDNDIDLGTSSLEFKDAYFDGTVTTDALVADTADINGGTVDGATVGANSASSGAFTTITASSSITGSGTVQGTTITATTAFVPDASDGAALGTSSLEFSDLFLADGAVINFGDDQDVSLTHVADTGLLLNSTMALQFNDASQYINAPSATVLDINATDEIELNATLVDINANVEVSGTLTVAGAVDFGDAALSNVGAVQLDSIAGDGDTNTSITFSGSDVITIAAGGDNQVTFTNGAIVPSTDNDIDLGTSSTEFKDAYFDGTVTTDALVADTADINGGTVDGAIIGGASAAAITGTAITGTSFVIGSADINEAELETIDGVTAGTVAASKAVVVDSNKDIGSFRNITLTGELDAATLDISGDADIDGTLEADAITIGGVTLAETISDTVGAMVTSNTESGITVAYQDADNTLDFTIGTLNQDTTGTAAVATTVTITDNESTNENNAIVFTAGGDLDGGNLGLESDGDLKYNPSTGTLSATNISVSGTFSTVNSVTMNANNAVVFEGSTADAHETTLSSIDATGDRTINLPNVSGTLPVLAAASATQISSTPEELNILDGATVVVGEINALDLGSTAVGTAIASKAVILDSNKDYTGIRNLTITGELDGATLDISGDADIDGTLETDALTINGSALNYKAFGTASIMLGDNATGTIDAADNNTGVGVDIFAALTSGDDNVVVGKSAMTANTTGSGNVAAGKDAMIANTTGNENVGIGLDALTANTTGDNNIGIGAYALLANTTAGNNIGIGFEALKTVTTGTANVAVGFQALKTNAGGNNTALGNEAMEANTTGADNTAVGQGALEANTTASNNTGLGKQALAANTTGTENSAVGSGSLRTNTTGDNNTAFGYECLRLSTTSDNNTAMGHYALGANTTGEKNTGVGATAGDAITTGAANTTMGFESLTTLTTGSNNVAIGEQALAACTTGGNNTAVGRKALKAVTTGGSNDAFGLDCADNLTTGSSNTLIGNGITTASAGTSNANGFGLGLSCADNYTTIGQNTADIRTAHGSTEWGTVSDERVKKDIQDSTVGLAFINDLRPVTFNYKNKGDLPENFRGYEENSTEVYKNPKTQHGFIAQEVKAAIDKHSDIKDGFNMWDDDDPAGQQRVAETSVIPILVKAVQELSAQVEELKAQINEEK